MDITRPRLADQPVRQPAPTSVATAAAVPDQFIQTPLTDQSLVPKEAPPDIAGTPVPSLAKAIVQKPHKPAKPHTSGVGSVIMVAVSLMVVLSGLAVYAYSKSQ
jgi:hypothetical protein